MFSQHRFVISVALIASIGCVSGSSLLQTRTASTVDDLLAADRGFAAASESRDLVTGISAMFADDVSMPYPIRQMALTAAAATQALRSVKENEGARASWVPVGAGVSRDGSQGFTFGFMTVTRADRQRVPLKYMSYWVRGSNGWRVVAYKRAARGAGAETAAAIRFAPSDASEAAPSASEFSITQQSLDSTERQFSIDAQQIGLEQAFRQYGSADAVNMGGATDTGFIIGADSIARHVGGGGPTTASPVRWAPERVIVAGSGDLGVSIGWITSNTASAGTAPRFPFFTVWRRRSRSEGWRYVAE
jgi:hypothetical protein